MRRRQGPFCQSCAMPMGSAADFGSNADGSRNEDYCVHCYQAGVFTWPEAKLDHMIAFCAGVMAKSEGISEEEARARLGEFMPKLKRWRKKA